MSTDLTLSGGICQKLHTGNSNDESIWGTKPTLQFLSIKKVVPGGPNNPNATTDRYRIIISDGLHFLQAMLATQLNYLVEEDRIGKNTIALIENMSCQIITEKRSVSPLSTFVQRSDGDNRLVILLALRVLQRDGQKIGDPAPLSVSPQQQSKVDDTSVSAPSVLTAPAASPVTAQPHSRQAENRPSTNAIAALTPYQNSWRIKARVVQKSDIRHYSNQRGEGRFFSVTLMDHSAEIKGTAWNAVVDDLFEKLQENRVYYVSKARVNLAKKKFSTVPNDYELSFDRGTEIEEVRSPLQPLRLGT